MLSSNSIVVENLLPGSPESQWGIDGSGSPTIQGYAAEFSVNQGDTVEFKIDTLATDYRLDIYRMGYYGGLGARLVATVEPTGPLGQSQPAGIVKPETGLIDYGNWSVSATWDVPDDATSGIYFAKVVREDGVAGASHILFIVRDDDGESDILLQTSDTTWQAYNSYGGNSLYVGQPDSRAYEVSYNRPFNNRSWSTYQFTNYVFYTAYPMVRWLEANGYDVSYSSGIDTHRSGEELLEHDVFMTVGHDEYWSAQQRENVEAARDAGVNLAFFTGNDLYWKTRWESSIDGAETPYDTLVSYKETHANAKIDPEEEIWTGTWRDPRFASETDGGLPENALTGTIFTVNGDGSGGTYMLVPSADGDLRFWRNTDIAELGEGQYAVLANRTLGYEWNEPLDNGYRPAGLVELSHTTHVVLRKLVDYGNVSEPGTATHSLTLYKAESGALVFSAGTIQWSWGLDDNHDWLPTVVDARMQQATVNLLADMGVSAGSLQAGLVATTASTDFALPTSQITSPVAGETVRKGVATTIRGTAVDSGGGVVGGVEVSVDGGLTWHAAKGRETWYYEWTPETTGTAVILSRAVDDSGNLESPSAGRTVVVAEQVGHSIWSESDAPLVDDNGDSGAVEVGMKFRSDVAGYVTGVRFYKSEANTGTHVGKLWSAEGKLLASVKFTGETESGWQEAKFDQPVHIDADTTYVVSYYAPNGHYAIDTEFFNTGVSNGTLHALASGVDGLNGVAIYGDGSLFPRYTYRASNYWVDVTFTEAAVASFGPADLSQNVAVDAPLTVTFNSPMQAASINSSSWQLFDSSHRLVAATVTYNAATRTATLTPKSPLIEGSTYTSLLYGGQSGVHESTGEPLEGDKQWSFATAPLVHAKQSLFNATDVPAIVDSGDAREIEVGMRFTTDVDGYVTGVRFYKSAANVGGQQGNLWTADGKLLAAVTFTSETASCEACVLSGCLCRLGAVTLLKDNTTGWHEAKFAEPVFIEAGQEYIVSYHTEVGHYSVTPKFFATNSVNSGPLHAAASGVNGKTGVYAYGRWGTFPEFTNGNANYWVDVSFVTSLVSQTSPIAGGQMPQGTPITVQFSQAIQADRIGADTVQLLDASQSLVAASVQYNAATRTATITPAATLPRGSSYTLVVRGGAAGVRSTAGGALPADHKTSFQIAPNDEEVLAVNQPLLLGEGERATIFATNLLTTDADDPASALVYTLLSDPAFGSILRGGAVATSFTQADIDAGLVAYLHAGGGFGIDSFDFLVDDGRGTATAGTFELRVREDTAGASIWSLSQQPIVDSNGDSGSVEVGMKFRSSEAGYVTGVRFYKSLGNTGTHVGHLWSGDGKMLGSVTFTSETASGWQEATFATPIYIEANTTYVVSYHAPNGNYAIDVDFFNNRVTNGSLTALASGDDGLNGVAIYGNGSLFPKYTYRSSNYWVDVRFQPLPAPVDTIEVLAKNLPLALNQAATATITNSLLLTTDTEDGPSAITYTVTTSPTSGTLIKSGTATMSFTQADINGGLISYRHNGGTSTSDSFAFRVNDTMGAGTTGTFSIAITPLAVEVVQKNLPLSLLQGATATITSSHLLTTDVEDGPSAITYTITNAPTRGTLLKNGTATTSFTQADINNGLISYRHNNSTNTTDSFAFRVNDTMGAGTTGSFSITITPLAVEVIEKNSPLSITQGATATITSPLLLTTDVEDGPTKITYTVTTAPTRGTLLKNGTATTSFTQADINSGLISYRHNNSTNTTDSFAFRVNDTMGAGTTGTFSIVVTLAPVDPPQETTSYSLWSNSEAPLVASNGDPNAVELGMKFRSEIAGYVTGVRFYKSVGNTGTHIGHLWSADGKLLASATFAGETASGWQEVSFSTPVLIAANTTYIVSYHAPNGHYAIDTNYFTSSGAQNGPLRALASGVDGLNGVAMYGAAGTFPKYTYLNSNYWVDVKFQVSPGAEHVEVIEINSPLNVDQGKTAVIGNTHLLTTDIEDAAGAITYTVTTAPVHGTLLKGGVAVTSFTQAELNAGLVSYRHDGSATTGDGFQFRVNDSAGSGTVASFSITIMPQQQGLSLWSNSSVPTMADNGDPHAVEVGMKFQSSQAGYVTGVRFYKSAANTGTHIGHLWSADGKLLASVTFTGESASGWQQALFSNPVRIDANTTYVVSYFAPNGHYAIDVDYFATSGASNGPLRALASGVDGLNGVAVYGNGTLFPQYTYRSSNYWVDVVFQSL